VSYLSGLLVVIGVWATTVLITFVVGDALRAWRRSRDDRARVRTIEESRRRWAICGSAKPDDDDAECFLPPEHAMSHAWRRRVER
jgi:hypothetical protein